MVQTTNIFASFHTEDYKHKVVNKLGKETMRMLNILVASFPQEGTVLYEKRQYVSLIHFQMSQTYNVVIESAYN